MSGDAGNKESRPSPLDPEDENNLTIDEFIELYTEFRGVLHEKEEKYPNTLDKTPVKEAVALFRLWFIDMSDREMIGRLRDEDLLDNDDDEDYDDPNRDNANWWKKGDDDD